jgi:hypothetical protein
VKLILQAVFLSAIVIGPALAQLAPKEPSPNPLGHSMITPEGMVHDSAMIRPPLLPEDSKYRDLNGDEMKLILREMTAISIKDRDRGNPFWGRNLGQQGHVDTQDWTIAKFRHYGLADVRKEPIVIGPVWTVASYDITFESDGQSFKLTSSRPSRLATPPGGLNLPLIWVGTGSEADFLGRDVQGKAVLVQDIPLPGDLRHSAALEGVVARAYAKGAAAVGLVFGISDNFAIWQDTGGKHGFNLGYEDGIRVRNLLGQGKEVRLKYKLDAGYKSGLPAAHIWGTLPGATDEEILVVAHMDGYFEAALDNASGMAVMMGIIKHYANIPQSQRRRTMRFVATAGHHADAIERAAGGGPGTRSLHEKHDFSKTAWLLNLEHVAVVRTKYWGPHLRLSTAVSPMRWSVFGSERATQIALENFRRFNVGIIGDMDPRAVGEISAIFADAPSIQSITSPEIKHTEQDTADWIPAAGLEQIARAHSRIIDQLDTLPISAIRPKAAPPAQMAAGDR